MDRDEYRRASLEVWSRMAEGWGREREFIWEASREVGDRLVDALDPSPGDTLLELAAGVGDTGFAAAVRLGDGGRLISSDFSPQMVAAAKRRAEELGVGNAEFRVIDAERVDIGDDTVDGVLCRWGYMLMADPAAAFGETRRVLREGGRLAFSVWGPAERNAWASIPGRLLVELGHLPAPEPDTPQIFALADRERIRELVIGAGFGDPWIEEVAMRWAFGDADAYWRFTTSLAGALAMTINELPAEEQNRIRAEIERRIAGQDDRGYEMEGLCLNVLAS